MKHDEIRALSADIALAVRAQGQKVADAARREKMGASAADLIMKFFNQAADAAEARGIMLALAAMDAERKPEPPPMNWFVWILRNGRLTCQAWSERTFSIHKDGGPRIVALHELKEEERGLSLYDLVGRYPAPEVVL